MEERVRCPICEDSFPNERELRLHNEEVHAEAMEEAEVEEM